MVATPDLPLERGTPVSPSSAAIAHLLEGAPVQSTAHDLVEALDELLVGRVVGYISTPITTGPELVAWRRGSGRHEPVEGAAYRTFVAEMMVRNTERARPLAASLEERLGVPVIDPTRLGVLRDWRQPDYHGFWIRVIERFVQSVAFADGWQYSTGCSLEFEAALCQGCELRDARLSPLGLGDGLALLEQAAVELEEVELDASAQRGVLGRVAERSVPR